MRVLSRSGQGVFGTHILFTLVSFIVLSFVVMVVRPRLYRQYISATDISGYISMVSRIVSGLAIRRRPGFGLSSTDSFPDLKLRSHLSTVALHTISPSSPFNVSSISFARKPLTYPAFTNSLILLFRSTLSDDMISINCFVYVHTNIYICCYLPSKSAVAGTMYMYIFSFFRIKL